MASDRVERMAEDTEAARTISRDAILRVTLLSASIVAFSATLLSIDQIDLDADQSLLGVSWSLFAAVVILGPLSVAIEARAQFVVAWRASQPQHFDGERRPTLFERLQLLAIALYSLTLRPRSLFFARHTDYNADKPTQGMWINFRMVLLLHEVVDLAMALELIVWVLFASAVIVLLVAVYP
jgi:hypothetical protein